jgi:hypothetical protein
MFDLLPEIATWPTAVRIPTTTTNGDLNAWPKDRLALQVRHALGLHMAQQLGPPLKHRVRTGLAAPAAVLTSCQLLLLQLFWAAGQLTLQTVLLLVLNNCQ